MDLFAWGFCGPIFNIIENLKATYQLSLFSVSDGPSTNLNIHDLFFLKVQKPQADHGMRNRLLNHFETFKELYSRHWYPRSVSDQEYLDSFNTYIDYFSHLFQTKKFSAAIFSNIPHEGPDFVAFLIAKERNLKTLIFYQTIFTNRVMVAEQLNLYSSALVPSSPTKDLDQLESTVEQAVRAIGDWFYMKTSADTKHFGFKQLVQNSRKCFKKNIFLMMKLIAEEVRYYHDYRQSVCEDVSLDDEDFVYFPLHLQPELTTSILGNGFTNQLKAIRHLSENIPDKTKIIVKENPKQSAFKRPAGYLQELTKIPKVIFVPVNFSTMDLIHKCRAVVSINGTVGWEAINLNKPVVYYGQCWYRSFPNVYQYTELDKVFSRNLSIANRAQVQKFVVNFLHRNTLAGTVDNDYAKVNPDFDDRENSQKLANYIFNQCFPTHPKTQTLSV